MIVVMAISNSSGAAHGASLLHRTYAPHDLIIITVYHI